jgi:hypothetical protein
MQLLHLDGWERRALKLSSMAERSVWSVLTLLCSRRHDAGSRHHWDHWPRPRLQLQWQSCHRRRSSRHAPCPAVLLHICSRLLRTARAHWHLGPHSTRLLGQSACIKIQGRPLLLFLHHHPCMWELIMLMCAACSSTAATNFSAHLVRWYAAN